MGNFDIKEYRNVLDATVVKTANFDKISLDLRMRLSLVMHKLGPISDPSMPVVPVGIEEAQHKHADKRMEFQSMNEITIMRNNENMA